MLATAQKYEIPNMWADKKCEDAHGIGRTATVLALEERSNSSDLSSLLVAYWMLSDPMRPAGLTYYLICTLDHVLKEPRLAGEDPDQLEYGGRIWMIPDAKVRLVRGLQNK